MGTCSVIVKEAPQIIQEHPTSNNQEKFNVYESITFEEKKQTNEAQNNFQKTEFIQQKPTGTFKISYKQLDKIEVADEELFPKSQSEVPSSKSILSALQIPTKKQKNVKFNLQSVSIDKKEIPSSVKIKNSKPGSSKKILGEISNLQYENNSIYQGETMNGLRHGRGKLIESDGTKFSGTWVNNFLTGYGQVIKPNGDHYQGNWLNSMAHGYGTYITADGKKYSGEWLYDKQHGKGIQIWQDGAQYKGNYKNGDKNGKGHLSFSDGSYYDGQFQGNQIHGYGIYSWSCGKKYQGSWKHNKMDGSGKLLYQDGSLYEGDFKQDKRHGNGKFTWPDGKIYTGGWINGKMDGIGQLEYNGLKKKGEWVQGKKVRML